MAIGGAISGRLPGTASAAVPGDLRYVVSKCQFDCELAAAGAVGVGAT
jgi:hypothetical protein